MNKQTAVRWLRRTRLLPAAEQIRYAARRLQNLRANRQFVRQHPRFAVPPAHLAYDAYGTVNYATYEWKGRRAAEYLAGLIQSHVGTAAVRVCDWGCGPARIVRHLPAVLRAGSQVHGTDQNAETIAWCRANIPGVNFDVNGLAPPLPFRDGALDVLYSVSVLTHLSETMHVAWMAELWRVVRPGGTLILTLHGDRCASTLLRDERASYDAGRLVVRGCVREGTRTFVAYHSARFVREVLLTGFDVLPQRVPAPPYFAGLQDVYVARRR